MKSIILCHNILFKLNLLNLDLYLLRLNVFYVIDLIQYNYIDAKNYFLKKHLSKYIKFNQL